jgi:hypothetical protein
MHHKLGFTLFIIIYTKVLKYIFYNFIEDKDE